MLASRNVLVNDLKMKENNTAFTTNFFFIQKGNDTDTSPVNVHVLYTYIAWLISYWELG